MSSRSSSGTWKWALGIPAAENLPQVAALLVTSTMPQAFRSALGGKVYEATQAAVLDANIEGCQVSTHVMVQGEIGQDEDGKPIQVLLGALAMQQWGTALHSP